ncbi:unnamed protein product, partial [Mesorhabditis spiculigera]
MACSWSSGWRRNDNPRETTGSNIKTVVATTATKTKTVVTNDRNEDFALEESDKLLEIVDKMMDGKDVEDMKEKWVKKAIERKMIPAEFTSEEGFWLEIDIMDGGCRTSHQFTKGLTDLQEVYCSFIQGIAGSRKNSEFLMLWFQPSKPSDISQMMTIFHSPPFRGIVSRSRCLLSLVAFYEWAGVWSSLGFTGDRSKDGINFSSYVIRSLQKLLNGGSSGGSGDIIHRGPWYFPFIGEKQMAFEAKWNLLIVLITPEDRSESKYLWIFQRNKPDVVLSISYTSRRSFKISTATSHYFEKYEQMQLGIIPKDNTTKIASVKKNEWTYQRIVEPERKGETPTIWTANYRPSFDDINCFDCLKGPLPDMSYCHEFSEIC